jgi:hypothetical protein
MFILSGVIKSFPVWPQDDITAIQISSIRLRLVTISPKYFKEEILNIIYHKTKFIIEDYSLPGLTLYNLMDRCQRFGGSYCFPLQSRPGREADYSPATIAEVKKTWVYTTTPPYVFMA